MSRWIPKATLMMALIASLPIMGWALTGEMACDKPVKEGYWPNAAVKAINAHRRVYGIGGDDFGTIMYFVGNTDNLNNFLATLAGDEESVLGVTLTTESGSEVPPLTLQAKAVTYSWSLHIRNHRSTVLVLRQADESEEQYEKRSKVVLSKLPQFSLDVRIPVGGSIDLDGLKLPLAFEASVDGRLNRFVQFHNDRRESVRDEGKPLSETDPTTEHKAIGAHGHSATIRDKK